MTDREKLIMVLESAESAIYWNSSDKGFIEKVADHLLANDVVSVVRCKDCIHWKPGDSKGGNSIEDLQWIGGCKWTKCCRREMDFCSMGERKDNAM